MTSYKQWTVDVQQHPGSSADDIANEPNWGAGHQHRVGFRDSNNRVPGLSNGGDDHAEIEQARQARVELQNEISTGKLVNFRDLIEHQMVRTRGLRVETSC